MSLTLTKGASVSLTKEVAAKGKVLSNVVVGAGWDPATEGAEIDLDAMVVIIGADGQAVPDEDGKDGNVNEGLVYFGNKTVAGIVHQGDNLTGEGDGDDEQIHIDLNNIPSNAKELAVVVAAYSDVTFDKVKSAFVRLVNKDGDEEIARFDLSENAGAVRGVELGRLSKNDAGEWEFKATGEARQGDFNGVVASYGLHN